MQAEGPFFSNLVFLLTLLSFLKLHGQDLAAIRFRNAGFWLTSSTPVLVLFCSQTLQKIRKILFEYNSIKQGIYNVKRTFFSCQYSLFNNQYSPVLKIQNALPTLKIFLSEIKGFKILPCPNGKKHWSPRPLPDYWYNSVFSFIVLIRFLLRILPHAP